jgi:hypothetical protein
VALAGAAVPRAGCPRRSALSHRRFAAHGLQPFRDLPVWQRQCQQCGPQRRDRRGFQFRRPPRPAADRDRTDRLRADGGSASGVGNIALAAKYRFAHQERCGRDVSTFPRWILPSVAGSVGERHHAFELPIWLEKDFGRWSTFGGAGITLQRGAGTRDYALVGWAITRQVLPRLQLGAELFHRTADVPGGLTTTIVNAGLRYDFSEHYHLLGSTGPGIQNAALTSAHSWYLALLVTR